MSKLSASRPAMAALLLLLLLLAAAGVMAGTYELLERYVVDNGGMVRTKIGINKEGVRGLFAREDVKKGEILLSVDAGTILNAGSVTGSFLTPALTLLRELRHPASRFKPFLDSMPKQGEVLNACTLDRSLWPLLESAYWSSFADSWQTFVESAFNGTANASMELTIAEALGSDAQSLTLEELKFACALSATRYVASGRRNRLLMIPIYDMANHRSDCNNTLAGTDEAHHASLLAGTDLKAGDEICYGYGDVAFRADSAVSHYGFLLRESPPRLLQVDHHQFNPTLHHQHFTEERFEATSPDQVRAEVARLQGIQAHLQQLDKEAARTKSRPKKGEGWVSDLLLDLQAYRRQAIDYELKRLQKLKA